MNKLCTDENRSVFDDFYMEIAFMASTLSRDPVTKVGAVVLDSHGNYLNGGYNSMPHGRDNGDDFPWGKDPKDPYQDKHSFVCHAELNAIAEANLYGNMIDGTIYVTLFPCNQCAMLIIQSGIKKVVYFSDKHAEKPSTRASKKMFNAAGVQYIQHIIDTEILNVSKELNATKTDYEFVCDQLKDMNL